jgi:hypothetical protein
MEAKERHTSLIKPAVNLTDQSTNQHTLVAVEAMDKDAEDQVED